MNIERELDRLKGANFTHDGTSERLNDWRFAGGIYTVETTKKSRRFPVERLQEWLSEITVDESTITNDLVVINKKEANFLSEQSQTFSTVNEMIMKNLERINKGETFSKDDLDRAKVTNDSAKALTEMAKVQVEMLKQLRS